MNGSEHTTETVEDLLPDGYRHDATRVPALARVADAACDGVADPHDAALQVEAVARQVDPQVDRAAAVALYHTFMYGINVAPVQEQPDAQLGPIEGPSLLPIALREAGEDLRQLWLELADEVRHPVARARLAANRCCGGTTAAIVRCSAGVKSCCGRSGGSRAPRASGGGARRRSAGPPGRARGPQPWPRTAQPASGTAGPRWSSSSRAPAGADSPAAVAERPGGGCCSGRPVPGPCGAR